MLFIAVILFLTIPCQLWKIRDAKQALISKKINTVKTPQKSCASYSKMELKF